MEGKWNFTVHTYMGDMNSVYEFKVDGDVLTGTATDCGNGATAPVDNGKFDGKEFSFQITIKTPVGELTNDLKGVVDGDKITGTSTNPMGSFEVTGVRA